MIHLIIDDLYKYICTFLGDKDYRSLTKTCKKLFNNRHHHSLRNYYGLNVLLFTGYSISHLDLNKKFNNKINVVFKKEVFDRFLEITHIITDAISVHKLKYFSKACDITFSIKYDINELKIADQISNLKVSASNNITNSTMTLIGGENLVSLTIKAHTNITKLQAPKLETLIIENNSAIPMDIDLRKFTRLHTFISESPIGQFVPSPSLRILKIIASKNTYIERAALPNLKALTLQKYNGEIILPDNLQKLDLADYNGQLKLPNSLRILKLDYFNQDIILNGGLIEASFGTSFDKPLVLPSTLKILSLGMKFLSKITFNDNLEILDLRLVECFNSIDIKDIPKNTKIQLYIASDVFKLLGTEEFKNYDSKNSESESESENSLSEVD